jgi:hypothetical protein
MSAEERRRGKRPTVAEQMPLCVVYEVKGCGWAEEVRACAGMMRENIGGAFGGEPQAQRVVIR